MIIGFTPHGTAAFRADTADSKPPYMKTSQQIKKTAPSRTELLTMLSNALPCLASKEDFFACSASNLLERLTEMERAGYTIHTPFKAPQQHKPKHTTWLLPITTPYAHCIVSLYVPGLNNAFAPIQGEMA